MVFGGVHGAAKAERRLRVVGRDETRRSAGSTATPDCERRRHGPRGACAHGGRRRRRRRRRAGSHNARAPPRSRGEGWRGDRRPLARRGAIGPTSQGRPTAARPIITASAPEARSIARASSSEPQSPLTTSGIEIASCTARTARPVGAALVELAAGAAMHCDHPRRRRPRARRASSGALRLASSQPSRIFTVTGRRVAATVAAMRRTAWSRSRISAEPASRR